MKKLLTLLAVTGLVLCVNSPFSTADPTGGRCPAGKCPFKKHGIAHDDYYVSPITAKFMMKAHFLLERQKELGLREDQIRQIKELKLETKKAYLRVMTEHKIFELDILHKLSEPKLDKNGINSMIDQMTKTIATSAKDTVAAYEKLKAVLSEDQLQKAKELWLEQKN